VFLLSYKYSSFNSAASQAFTLEAGDLRIVHLLVGAAALFDHMITYTRTSRLSEVKATELRPLAKHTEHGLNAAKTLSSAPERAMTTKFELLAEAATAAQARWSARAGAPSKGSWSAQLVLVCLTSSRSFAACASVIRHERLYANARANSAISVTALSASCATRMLSASSMEA
jgi:hypothetical protein